LSRYILAEIILSMPPSQPQRNRAEAAAEDFQAAFSHHRAGRIDRAEALYRKVLHQFPVHADTLNMMGLIALDRGRLERAVQLIQKATEAAPRFADAWLNLGNALIAVQRTEKAIATYQHALILQPGFAAAYSNLGRAYNIVGDHEGAAENCRAALALDPGLADAWHHLGMALRGMGDLVRAEEALRSALERRPRDSNTRRELGELLVERDRPDEGLALLSALAAENPRDLASAETHAHALYRAADLPSALEAYRRAAALAPRRSEIWNGLGHVHRALGRFAEAESDFRRALSVSPNNAEAHRNLALIGAIGPNSAEIARLAGELDGSGLTERDRVTAGFALGHLLDREARYDEAFARYAAANARFREIQAAAGRRFDREALSRRIDELIARGVPSPSSAAGFGEGVSDLPVFIVGMPRSGTSLVEQIAATHCRVHGAGELRDIGRIAQTLGFEEPARRSDAWDARRARELGDAHLARLRRLGGEALRVIDKMPDNVFLLGLIAAVFPGARVIMCERDPRDTCLSAFFTHFSKGNLFSYDLADCACRHRETRRLVSDWSGELPLRTHVVRYEALVADFENEARRLIRFLGLDWDPACLAFHETERPVLTASTWQVRQPLYSASVGRWRHYARHVEGLGF
jgi:tetratricopeptide (TPR) repeat protein